MKFSIILLFIITHGAVISQNTGITGEKRRMAIRYNLNAYDLDNKHFSGEKELPDEYLGTPYLFDDFLPGKIYFDDQLYTSNSFLRYNLYLDQLEIKESNNENQYGVITKELGLTFEISDSKYEVMKTEGGELQFFELAFSGKNYSFYKRNQKKYYAPKLAQTSLTRDSPASFKDEIVYYYENNEGVLIEIPTSKRKLSEIFGDKETRVAKFIKTYKINPKKDDDLRRLFSFVDEL